MKLSELIRNIFRGLIKPKTGKMIGNGDNEKNSYEDKEKFKNRIKQNSKDNCIYSFLKHYKMSEEFARNLIIQNTIRRILMDKYCNLYGNRDIDLLSVEELINLLDGQITVMPNSITARKESVDEISDEIYFVNIYKDRKGVKIREEEVDTYTTYNSYNKKYKEYNKYNVLIKRIEETEVRDKYESDSNMHTKETIMRDANNPFIMHYESEDINENEKYNEKVYYNNIDSCIWLERFNMFENASQLKEKDTDIPEFHKKMLIKKLHTIETLDARNFMFFCKKEYPEMFTDQEYCKNM